MTFTRRMVPVVCVAALLAACTSGESPAPPTLAPTPTLGSAQADAVINVVRATMAEQHLKAAIVRVTIDGREVVTQAFGESMTGVPATTDMHFRNGAVAIAYVATLLLELVDEKKVSLDDKLSTWLPDVPNSDRVTLGQLAQMTSGYVDYVIGNEPFTEAFYADPFKQREPQELLSFATTKPLLYEPGTNWDYAHTNYVLLGLALEKATGQDMPTLMSEKVLKPLGLTSTANSFTPEIPSPVLHAFTSERRSSLKIPDGSPFYEDSTYWNPSWTITHGAIQTTTIRDLEASAVGIGSGKLLSKDSYDAMVTTGLRGKTSALPGCSTCAPHGDFYTFGLGLVISGSWLLQSPSFAGESGLMAYLPSQKVAIAVAATYAPEAFDDQGEYRYSPNGADALFRKIGAQLVPQDPPPLRPSK